MSPLRVCTGWLKLLSEWLRLSWAPWKVKNIHWSRDHNFGGDFVSGWRNPKLQTNKSTQKIVFCILFLRFHNSIELSYNLPKNASWRKSNDNDYMNMCVNSWHDASYTLSLVLYSVGGRRMNERSLVLWGSLVRHVIFKILLSYELRPESQKMFSHLLGWNYRFVSCFLGLPLSSFWWCPS